MQATKQEGAQNELGMTDRQFREDARLREALALALHDGALDLALTIVEQRYDRIDAQPEAPGRVSMRLLSQSVGRKQVRPELTALTQPWPEEEKEREMTFGTKHSVEEFDQVE